MGGEGGLTSANSWLFYGVHVFGGKLDIVYAL